MDASLETLVTAAYVFASALSIPRCGPRGKATDQELIALAVAQAVTGPASDSAASLRRPYGVSRAPPRVTIDAHG